ncbi:MAG: hypothetical protein ACT4QC_06505 [Planctomycetaceae bacterium]
MSTRSLSELIVDVLTWCERDASDWPPSVRSECALIHARFEALKLDRNARDAWRQAQAEWVRRMLRKSGLVRVVYRLRAP